MIINLINLSVFILFKIIYFLWYIIQLSGLIYYLIIRRFDFDTEKIRENREKLFPSIIANIKNKGNFKKKNKEAEIACDLDWPVCSQSEYLPKTIPESFCFRKLGKININRNFMDTYEQTGGNTKEEKPADEENLSEEELDKVEDKDEIFEGLMIERKKHICGIQNQSISERLRVKREKIEDDNFEKYIAERKNKFQKSIFVKPQVLSEKEPAEGGFEIMDNVNKIVQDVEKEKGEEINIPKQKKEDFE